MRAAGGATGQSCLVARTAIWLMQGFALRYSAPGDRYTDARTPSPPGSWLRQQPVGASSDKAWAFDANLWEVLCHSGLPADRDELQALAGS